MLDYDRVALILVESAFYGDKDTAVKWGITERTIRNYRGRLDEDSELSEIFQNKKELFEATWADEIPAALRSSIRFLRKAAEQADPSDPNVIHAIAGQAKILAEIEITRTILNARFNRSRGADGTEDRQMGSAALQPTN